MRRIALGWCVFVVVVMCGVAGVPVREARAQVPPGATVESMRFMQTWVFPHVSGAAGGTEIAEASASTIGRVLPYIGPLVIGVSVAGLIINAVEGQIGIRTRGQADAEFLANPVISPTFPGAEILWSDGETSTWYSTPDSALAYIEAHGRYGACTATGSVNVNDAASGNPNTATQTDTCPGTGSGTETAYAYMICTTNQSKYLRVGSAPSETLATFQSNNGCAIPPPGTAQGGTDDWAPRTYPSTVPGGPDVTGWEAPSDPQVQPQPFTPASPMTVGTTNGVNAIATVTADPDGGYKVQTWSPTFADPAHPTTQTGWTINTVTINNAGQVVNSTQVITDTSVGPPTTGTGQPAGNGATDPNNTTAPPIVCGSLSCESTQQAVKTDLDTMKSDLQGVHSDTTAIHSDTSAIKQNTADILTELKADGAPTLPDQSGALQAAKDADKASSDAAISAIQDEGTAAVAHDNPGIWGNWVFTPPVGSCQAPTATLRSGSVVTWDYCPMVDSIRSVIGWLFAVLGSWCCWNIMVRKG